MNSGASRLRAEDAFPSPAEAGDTHARSGMDPPEHTRVRGRAPPYSGRWLPAPSARPTGDRGRRARALQYAPISHFLTVPSPPTEVRV